ncbi:MAG TPA: hypothetical protein VFL57_18580, partial [Bryobacteraceae bacterium]|nr:hypothetical protein [Bryobacteraceae bacterium]
RAPPRLWRLGASARGWERLFVELLGFALLLQLLVVLQPEVGADGLGIHLNVADSVARHGLWDFNFKHVVWAVMPMGGDWVWTAACMLGGEMAARLMNFACLAALAGLVTSAARTALAGALFISSPLVQLVTGSLFIENVWTLFVVAGIVGIAQGRLYTAAVLLGAAASCKFGALAFVVPALVVLAIRTPKRALATAGIAILFAMPPYANAYLKTGNPFFPFFNATFKTPYYDQTSNFRDSVYSEPLRFDTVYDVTFHTARYVAGQDGGFAFQLLLLLPFALVQLSRGSPPLHWTSVAVSAVGFVLAFLATPYLRYIYPVLPLLSIVIAPAVCASRAARVLASAVIPLNVWFLPASGWYHRNLHVSSVFEPEAVHAYVRESAAPRLLVAYLNKHARGQPVLFITNNQSAMLAGTAYSDEWYHWLFAQLIANAASPVECLRITSERSIRWFIAPTHDSGMVPHYAVLHTFLERYTRRERVEGHFHLTRLIPDYEGAAGLQRAELAAAGMLVAPPGTYDDFHEAVYLRGKWTRDQQFRQAADRSLTYSSERGDFARVLFRGTGVRYVFTMALNRGIALIDIDGVEKDRIDLYSKATRWQQSRTYSGLAPGQHTLTVQVLGERNPRSAGTFVDIDAIVIE